MRWMRRSALAWAFAIAACGRVEFDPVPSDGAADADGAPDARSAIVARFEAESGQLTAPFQLASDPLATAGRYVLDGNVMGTTGPGNVVYAFTVSQAGTYYLWGRIRSTSQGADSFFLQIDGGADHYYQATDCTYLDEWRWVVVSVPRNCPDPLVYQPFTLSGGAHTLKLHSREGGSAIDQLMIVDDATFVATN